MSTDVSIDSAPSRRRWRPRFSLLAALLFITLVCFALGYAYRTRYCEVTALFRVSPQLLSIWDNDADRFDAREFEIFQKTQLSLLKSYFVMQAAVRNPNIASLSVFAGQADPAQWLIENIEVDFPNNDEILTIRLRGNRVHAQELRQVVDAVANAYEKEVIYAGHQQRLIQRDALARSVEKLRAELVRNIADLHEKKTAAGADSADVTMQQQELDVLTGVFGQMMRRLEMLDVNASMPEQSERIQKLQPAVVTFE